MERRTFLHTLSAAAFAPKRAYRVALIGNSNAGGFGHDWDQAWLSIPNVKVVAVADVNEKGRAAAKARTGAQGAYADYREMLATERPDIVTVCPRTLDERVPMVEAAAQAKAHILMEKPFARSLADARRLVSLCRDNGVKLQLGHPARAFSVTTEAKKLVGAGAIGVIQEMRARGKEDRRAGGEDLMVLGTHCFDLMRYFAGDPEWCFAHITQQNQELTSSMMHKATEPIGEVGGDNVAAMFGFRNGVHGYFASKSNDRLDGRRFGVTIYGSKGMLFLPLNEVPSAEPYLLQSPAWAPEHSEPWERVHYLPGTKPGTRPETNKLLALDLLEAIENNRQPLCSARDGLWTVAMVDAIYRSQASGGRVKLDDA